MRFGPQSGGKIEPVRVKHAGASEAFFVACRYFATEKVGIRVA